MREKYEINVEPVNFENDGIRILTHICKICEVIIETINSYNITNIYKIELESGYIYPDDIICKIFVNTDNLGDNSIITKKSRGYNFTPIGKIIKEELNIHDRKKKIYGKPIMYIGYIDIKDFLRSYIRSKYSNGHISIEKYNDIYSITIANDKVLRIESLKEYYK
jgi:hypothetical protein